MLIAPASREWLSSTDGGKPLCKARRESKLGARKIEVETVLRMIPNYLSDWELGEGHHGETPSGNPSVISEQHNVLAAHNVSSIACHITGPERAH